MKLNTRSLIAILIPVLTACGGGGEQKQENTNSPKSSALTIKGSDTVLPVAQKAAESFMKKNSSSAVTVTGGGTGVGISALLEGTTDIAMASRDLKMDEKLKLQDKGIDISTDIIAYDALAVVINKNNKVEKLSRKQLEDIFTGKITNWKDVGGEDEKIIVYSRESSSGTYEFFKEHVMDKKNYGGEILMMPATGSIVQSVSQTKGAIGYIGLAYVEESVKPVAVAFEENKFEMPTIEAAKSGAYPVSRPLYFFSKKSDQEKVKGFVDYLLSAEGQALVQEIGYVPVK